MDRRTRVAVAGASGIGRHHAKWHHRAGAEVVGFLGSSKDHCRQTARALSLLFPFRGHAYWDFSQLLADLHPEVVDVCLPNHLHKEVVTVALAAGCDVLCEKPLIWEKGRTGEELLVAAADVVQLAHKHGALLGICTQYVAAIPQYKRLYEQVRGPISRIDTFYAEMETLARGRRRSPGEIWVDMGPHPLSLLLAWMPGGTIDMSSLRTSFVEGQARAGFTFVDDESACACEITVRDRKEGIPVRRFGVNGTIVDCFGRAGTGGDYRSVLQLDGLEDADGDFLSSLIAQFHVARAGEEPLAVSADVGLRNMEMLVRVAQQAGALG